MGKQKVLHLMIALGIVPRGQSVLAAHQDLALNRKMRHQEKTWPQNERETRAAYGDSLRKTAFSVSSTFVKKVSGNMKEQCQRLHSAKGVHL